MTKTTIFAIIALTSTLLLGTSIVQAADHGDAPLISNDQGADIKAIPGWVDNNFRWYGEGKISQSDLLNGIKHLMENNLLHLSDKAAQEVSELREENTALKKKLGADGLVGPNTGASSHSPEWTDSSDSDPGVMRPGDEIMVILYPSPGADMQPGDEIMVLLRPSPGADMQPGDEIMVLLRPAPGAAEKDYSFVGSTNAHTADDAHKEWIEVLSIDMASHTAGHPDSFFDIWIEPEASSGDPDRPVITGVVPNADDRPTEEVSFYYNKIASASETVHDLVNNGETSTTGWDEGVAAFTSKNYDASSTSSGIHELGHALGMMNNAIEKEIQTIEGEIAILEELMDMYTSSSTSSTRASTQYSESDFQFIQRHTSEIDSKIQSLETGLRVLDEKLSTAGDDAQLANNDLPNAIAENQDTLDSLKAKTTQIDENGEFWFTGLTPGY